MKDLPRVLDEDLGLLMQSGTASFISGPTDTTGAVD